jgi:hypothetical protein
MPSFTSFQTANCAATGFRGPVGRRLVGRRLVRSSPLGFYASLSIVSGRGGVAAWAYACPVRAGASARDRGRADARGRRARAAQRWDRPLPCNQRVVDLASAGGALAVDWLAARLPARPALPERPAGRARHARVAGRPQHLENSAPKREAFPDDDRGVPSRGTSVPQRAGHRRITPDQSGAPDDATPENRCKAAIPKIGSGGPHGVRVPFVLDVTAYGLDAIGTSRCSAV